MEKTRKTPDGRWQKLCEVDSVVFEAFIKEAIPQAVLISRKVRPSAEMSVAKVATNEGLVSGASVRYHCLVESLCVERLMHHVTVKV